MDSYCQIKTLESPAPLRICPQLCVWSITVVCTGVQSLQRCLSHCCCWHMRKLNKQLGQFVQRGDGHGVTWPSNCLTLPGDLCATRDASYQPPLWVDTSAAWIFNSAAYQVADERWIIDPCRLAWISLERFGVRETISQEQVCVSFDFMIWAYDMICTLLHAFMRYEELLVLEWCTVCSCVLL